MSRLSVVNSPFMDPSRWVMSDKRAVAMRDGYPVSDRHTLVVPRRLVRSVFDMDDKEWLSCVHILRRIAGDIRADGFNVGVNIGEAAGQTVAHAHIHLIPRYRGDVEKPRGGVRNVIPHKGHY